MSALGAVLRTRSFQEKASGAVSAHFTADRRLGFTAYISSSISLNSRLPGASLTPQRTHMSDSAEDRRPVQPAPAAQEMSSPAPKDDFLVQYIIVRKDLWGSLGWPLGSVVAQACHASSAAMWTYRDEDATQQYLAPDNIDQMRKVRTACNILSCTGAGF